MVSNGTKTLKDEWLTMEKLFLFPIIYFSLHSLLKASEVLDKKCGAFWSTLAKHSSRDLMVTERLLN